MGHWGKHVRKLSSGSGTGKDLLVGLRAVAMAREIRIGRYRPTPYVPPAVSQRLPSTDIPPNRLLPRLGLMTASFGAIQPTNWVSFKPLSGAPLMADVAAPGWNSDNFMAPTSPAFNGHLCGLGGSQVLDCCCCRPEVDRTLGTSEGLTSYARS